MRREELRGYLERGLSLDAIAAKVGRHPSTVSYWMKRHGLMANGARKYGPKPELDLDLIGHLVAEGLSVVAIAERVGATPGRVRRRLRSAGLKTRQGENRQAARQALARGERSPS